MGKGFAFHLSHLLDVHEVSCKAYICNNKVSRCPVDIKAQSTGCCVVGKEATRIGNQLPHRSVQSDVRHAGVPRGY